MNKQAKRQTLLIQRRALMIGLCSLVAAPAVVRAASLMAIRPPHLACDEPATLASPAALILTISGWDCADVVTESTGGARSVPIYLSNTWRAAWF